MPPSGADLVVSEITVVWGSPPVGTAIPPNSKLNVKVRNSGNAAAGAFTVTLTAGSSSPQRVAASSLAAGQEATLVFNFQGGPVIALADANNQVTESDETNNSRSANIPIP
jgi:subtilase family serine protease